MAGNAAFLLNLRDSGVDFIAVDMPHADKFTVGIMAHVAEKERDMISERTKPGLRAAILEAVRGTSDQTPDAQRTILSETRSRLKSVVKTSSAWINFKKQGAKVLKSSRNDFDAIYRVLSARGVFINPSGELEASMSEYPGPDFPRPHRRRRGTH